MGEQRGEWWPCSQGPIEKIQNAEAFLFSLVKNLDSKYSAFSFTFLYSFFLN